MMNLSEAEVAVTTQKEMDNETHASDWFRLFDYGDIGEFYEACYSYFFDETDPVFRYPAWVNIPDVLINEKWFCPNFFEIRDAMERLDEAETDYFLTWCNCHGHNIATDDPYVLVTNYRDNHTSHTEFNNDTIEIPDDTFPYQSVTDGFFDRERYTSEIFSDDYN